MKLSELRENPNNPSKANEEELERLAGKLKRVPLGLTAMRIAYITDDPDGGKMVISGNKRLRVLKRAYGEDGECPDDWFQDITAMSEAERHEFIIDANVSDGEWDLERLLEQYGREELGELMPPEQLEKVLSEIVPEPPDDVEKEIEEKPMILRITFDNEQNLNEFLESVQEELNNKYHAVVNVSGGGL